MIKGQNKDDDEMEQLDIDYNMLTKTEDNKVNQ